MDIREESWKDFHGNDTVALSLNKEDQYTISEFIKLLEEAEKRFGDKMILIHDMNEDILNGFVHVYLNHGFDKDGCSEDDTICIFG